MNLILLQDFKNLWIIIMDGLMNEFYFEGFTFSWLSILLYSLLGSLFVGVLVHIFKSHE